MTDKQLVKAQIDIFQSFVERMARNTFGENATIDFSISNVSEPIMDVLCNSDSYYGEHNGSRVQLYSESHLPFDKK